ncbi:MAG: hypothetical protein PWQ59_2211 [Thermoanaerobacterium sp.]|nr:hypothetical protein [Thermoanaerobacterium sp.]
MSCGEKKKEILKEIEKIESQFNDWECTDKEDLYDESYNYFKIVFEKRKNISDSTFINHTVAFHGNISLELPIFDCIITIGIAGDTRSFWEEFSLIIFNKSEYLAIKDIPNILKAIDKFGNPENNLQLLFNKSVK